MADDAENKVAQPGQHTDADHPFKKSSSIQDHLDKLLQSQTPVVPRDEQPTPSWFKNLQGRVWQSERWSRLLKYWQRRPKTGWLRHRLAGMKVQSHLTGSETGAGWQIRVKDLLQQQRTGLTWLGIFLGLTLVLAYSLSPLGSVQHYRVTGNTEVSDQRVLKQAGLMVGQPVGLILTNQGYFSNLAHRNDPQLAKLRFELKWPNTMVVTVKEVPMVGYIQSGDDYMPVLATGQELTHSKVKSPLAGLPVYTGFTRRQQRDQVLKQFAQMRIPIRHAVSEVHWSPSKENPQRLVIFMNDGNVVLANANNFAKKLRYYPSMAAQSAKPSLIDLQMGAFARPLS